VRLARHVPGAKGCGMTRATPGHSGRYGGGTARPKRMEQWSLVEVQLDRDEQRKAATAVDAAACVRRFCPDEHQADALAALGLVA